MTVGKSPFGGNNQDETCRNILHVKLKFPAGLEPLAEEPNALNRLENP